jgi:hypothetical protein
MPTPVMPTPIMPTPVMPAVKQTVKQLQAQLKRQKLDTTGTKPELEARLAEAAAAAAAPKAALSSIDAKQKWCQDCQVKRPHFGLPGTNQPGTNQRLWCGSCAKSHEGAVPVGRALCGDCGVKQPSYGLPADGLIRWCSGCAKQREGAVDVEHNREYKPGRNR